MTNVTLKKQLAVMSLVLLPLGAAHAQTPPSGSSTAPKPAGATPAPAGGAATTPAPAGGAATTPAPAAAPPGDAPATAPPGDTPPPATDANVVQPAPATSDRGAFVVGVGVGGLFAQPFSKLGASFLVDVQIGYVLPYLKRGLAVLIDAGYTQPTTSGTQTDSRIDANSGGYSFDLVQRQLMFGLTLMYRATFIGSGRVAPYLGVGPRLWLLQGLATGAAGGSTIGESTEQSTKVGLGVPLGVDIGLGPGRLFGEVQLFWAPIDHRTTGESSVGSLAVGVGYRLML